MNGMKNSHAPGWISITGRTMPSDQPSSVMIWNSVKSDSGRPPNNFGNASPYSFVAITAKT